MMNRLLRLACRLDDSWLGDFLGSLCLFAGAYGLMLIGCGMGLK